MSQVSCQLEIFLMLNMLNMFCQTHNGEDIESGRSQGRRTSIEVIQTYIIPERLSELDQEVGSKHTPSTVIRFLPPLRFLQVRQF